MPRFRRGEARPREKPPALRVIGGLRWAGDASGKKSMVDTYLKCDKPENKVKNDREPVTGVALEKMLQIEKSVKHPFSRCQI